MSKKVKLKQAGISRHAMSLAKSVNASSKDGKEAVPEPKIDVVALEKEVMGESRDPDAKKSTVMERNLNQMVNMLQNRLQALSNAATERQQYCEDDLDVHSTRMSRFAPRIQEDFEEVGGGKHDMSSTKVYSSNNNLVGSQDVYIDANKLILKTKQSTESGKRLEVGLEEAFGGNSFGVSTSKGTKVAKATRAKKSEAQKHESKRQARIRLEKDLQVNMDNFVTRSVLDADIEYSIPPPSSGVGHADEQWPITLCWPTKDPRSSLPDNADGVMRPDLLLLYAIFKMTLPSGENVFKWLIKQTAVQQQFVFLFWYIKVKFFQKDAGISVENHLLKYISLEHIKVVELLGKKAREEHEKDFVYRYLPYILAHAIYYAFYYYCPGSRHLYTKPFRKTILMQVVKVIHGIQLCPVSVKVSWEELFPEELNADEGEEKQEEYPTKLSQPTTAQLKQTAVLVEQQFKETVLPSVPNTAQGSRPGTSASRVGTADSRAISSGDGGGSPSRTRQPRAGRLVGDDDGDAFGGSAPPVAENAGGVKVTVSDGDGFQSSAVAGSTFGSVGIPNTPGATMDSTGLGLGLGTGSRPGTATLPKGEMKTRIENNPLCRSTLLPPPKKPKAGIIFPRQPQTPMDAQSVSPLMQHYMQAPSGNVGRYKQTLSRTVPVSWCYTGGSDTHKRRPIPRELHDDISARGVRMANQMKAISLKGHTDRVAAMEVIDANMRAVLKSGATNISKFSHDLMKDQILRRRGGEKDTKEKIDIFGSTGNVQYNFTVEQLLQEDDVSEFL